MLLEWIDIFGLLAFGCYGRGSKAPIHAFVVVASWLIETRAAGIRQTAITPAPKQRRCLIFMAIITAVYKLLRA